MVEQLPDQDCQVIVHCGAMRNYVRRMIANVRGRQFLEQVDVVVIDSVAAINTRMGGFGGPVVVDHAVHEFGDHNVSELIKDILHMRSTATVQWV